MKKISFSERCSLFEVGSFEPRYVPQMYYVNAPDVIDGIVVQSSKPLVVDFNELNAGVHYRDYSVNNQLSIGRDPSTMSVITLQLDNLHADKVLVDQINSFNSSQFFDFSQPVNPE